MKNRDVYLKQLISFRDKPLIKVITGIRRCGKSTLLSLFEKHLIEDGVPRERIIRMNFESFEFDDISDYRELHAYIKERITDKNIRHYILLDEVQQVHHPVLLEFLGDAAGKPGLDIKGGIVQQAIGASSGAGALALRPDGPPLLNGAAGFSRKGPDPRQASYYYSRPRLAVSGSVSLDGREQTVAGSAWLDHEWSSELLPEGAQGWDWVGINLDDGGALMAFRMRGTDGRALWAAATLQAGGGAAQVLAPEAVAFEPGRTWRSPRTGIVYPVTWRLQVGARAFELAPLLDDQELDSRGSTGAVYWEGAVRLLEAGRERGRGYLEMTGYGDRIRVG